MTPDIVEIAAQELAFRTQGCVMDNPEPGPFTYSSKDPDDHDHSQGGPGIAQNRLRAFHNIVAGFGLQLTVRCDFRDCQNAIDRGPIVTFNRVVGAKNYLLTPLMPYYHGLQSYTFRTDPPDPIPFAEKADSVFWRGFFSGHYLEDGLYKTIGTLVERIKHNETDAFEAVQQTSRFRLCTLSRKKDWLDASYCELEKVDLHDHPLVENLQSHPVGKKAHFKHKYLIAATGNDYASSLPWMLNTNCLVLAETPVHHTYLNAHFKPWEHFVPVDRGFGNLEERFEWCRENQTECEAIITRANARHAIISTPEYRDFTDGQFLAYIGAKPAA